MLVFAEKRENMVMKQNNNLIFFVSCSRMCENTRDSSCTMGCTMGCTMVVLWLYYGCTMDFTARGAPSSKRGVLSVCLREILPISAGEENFHILFPARVEKDNPTVWSHRRLHLPGPGRAKKTLLAMFGFSYIIAQPSAPVFQCCSFGVFLSVRKKRCFL